MKTTRYSMLMGLCMCVLHATFASATTVPHDLSSSSFSQDWTNAGLITANDNWSGVPSIVGYLGDDNSAGAADPQTVLANGAATVDVIASQTAPNTLINGGVAEFAITNPVVALQGSATADNPYLIVYVDSTSRENVTISYNLRDIDGSADIAIQPLALQYRVGGGTGNSRMYRRAS